MNVNLSPRDAYSWFLWLCTQIVVVGLLLIFAGNVLSLFGFRVPYVPNIDFTALAYLCGAYWLYRKAG
jgi:hypothetical protein